MKRTVHRGTDPRSLRLDPDSARFREIAPAADQSLFDVVAAEAAEFVERRRVARMLTGTSHMGTPDSHRGRPQQYGRASNAALAAPGGTCSTCGARVAIGCEHQGSSR